MAQPPPRFSLGTFDVGTILKPKPSGNRLTWHNRLPDFLLEPLMLGPFLSQNQPEPSGNRLTWHNRLPDFVSEPLMLGPFLSQKPSGNRLTWHNRLPDFLLEPLMLGPFLSQNQPEPSGNRLPYEPPPRFSLGTFDVGTILKPEPSGNSFLMIFFGHAWTVGFSQIQPPTLGVYSGGSLTYPFFSGSFFLTWHPPRGQFRPSFFQILDIWTPPPKQKVIIWKEKTKFWFGHVSDLGVILIVRNVWNNRPRF